jgi:hypothetical protein
MKDLHATLDATENSPTYSMHFLACMHLQEMTMLQERKKKETNNGVPVVLSVLHELLNSIEPIVINKNVSYIDF